MIEKCAALVLQFHGEIAEDDAIDAMDDDDALDNASDLDQDAPQTPSRSQH
jgi:hypothetical protein